MKKLLTNPLFIVGVGVAVYLIATRSTSGGNAKKDFLQKRGLSIQQTDILSESDLDKVYKYIVEYADRDIENQAPADLRAFMAQLEQKWKSL